MFRTVGEQLWVIDAEWVPDPATGRRVYGLPGDLEDDAVVERMYREAGATPEQPRPYLKTVLCRVVSVAALVRRREGEMTWLDLNSLPRPEEPGLDEAALLGRFLGAIGVHRPQLVGFNLRGADLPILIQRALVHGLSLPGYTARPEKPWEGYDYFSHQGEGVVDLMDVFGAPRQSPSLHQLATACGLPGKSEADGAGVYERWRAGDIAGIVAYNETDVLTTYLLWLRAARLGGFVTGDELAAEQDQLARLLRERAAGGRTHLGRYLERWRSAGSAGAATG